MASRTVEGPDAQFPPSSPRCAPAAGGAGVFEDEDRAPLSALAHYCFCPRRAALIHLERIWEENRFTAEGRVLHERVDAGGSEQRRDVKRVFGLPIRSKRLGLSGKADVVEFHLRSEGAWQPYPVEHKRGRRKGENWDRVQLCAQAMCLEEMLGVDVPQGALFYGREKRREVVEIDEALRAETALVAKAVHAMLGSGRTPPPEYSQRCEGCSLLDTCLPRAVGKGQGGRVARYLASVLREA